MRTRVREATPEDVPGIHDLIRQLADYDRESDLFTASVADLEEAMFGDDAILHALVAEGEDGLAGVAVDVLGPRELHGGFAEPAVGEDGAAALPDGPLD